MMEEIKTDVGRLRKSRLLIPEPWSAFFLTNDGMHWDGPLQASGYVFVIREWSAHPLSSGDVAQIAEAVEQRMYVPLVLRVISSVRLMPLR